MLSPLSADVVSSPDLWASMSLCCHPIFHNMCCVLGGCLQTLEPPQSSGCIGGLLQLCGVAICNMSCLDGRLPILKPPQSPDRIGGLPQQCVVFRNMGCSLDGCLPILGGCLPALEPPQSPDCIGVSCDMCCAVGCLHSLWLLRKSPATCVASSCWKSPQPRGCCGSLLRHASPCLIGSLHNHTVVTEVSCDMRRLILLEVSTTMLLLRKSPGHVAKSEVSWLCHAKLGVSCDSMVLRGATCVAWTRVSIRGLLQQHLSRCAI